MHGSPAIPFSTLVRDTIATHGLGWAVDYYCTRRGLSAWEFRMYGHPLGGRTPEYMVRWDKGRMETGTSHCMTLTEARKEARALVAEGRAWAEVFRWAENAAGIRKVFICSYEVAVESGSEVA